MIAWSATTFFFLVLLFYFFFSLPYPTPFVLASPPTPHPLSDTSRHSNLVRLIPRRLSSVADLYFSFIFNISILLSSSSFFFVRFHFFFAFFFFLRAKITSPSIKPSRSSFDETLWRNSLVVFVLLLNFLSFFIFVFFLSFYD